MLNTLFFPNIMLFIRQREKNMAEPNWPEITTRTQNVQYLLLYYGNNDYANAPQCYVIRTLPVLFNELSEEMVTSGNQLYIQMCRCYQNKTLTTNYPAL
jgi:hypothetical protein